MACRNPRCERTTEMGQDFCCRPCTLDAAGSKKLMLDRRMPGVFHTHACEEREEARRRALAHERAAETHHLLAGDP